MARKFSVAIGSGVGNPCMDTGSEACHSPSMLKFELHNQDSFSHIRSVWTCMSGGQTGAGPLASLSSSISTSRRATAKGPELLVQTLLGLPQQFLLQQSIAERVYDFHQKANGFFPRACPECSSGEFFVPSSQSRSRSGSGASGSGGSGAVVAFESRPVVCDQCSRWFHAGCLGARHMEDLPVHPWLHCQGCHDTYVKLEALSQRGSLLFPLGPNGPLTYELVTPSDVTRFMSGGAPQAALFGDVKQQRMGFSSPNNVLPVLELLGGTGFDLQTISGFGDPWTEYDGGKYALLLRSEDGTPLAAATFNVFSSGLPVQVSLVAESQQSPGGHVESLFDILGSVVGDLDISSITLQPPVGADITWAKRMGFTAMHPSAVTELHKRVPLAYLDAPVYELEI